MTVNMFAVWMFLAYLAFGIVVASLAFLAGVCWAWYWDSRAFQKYKDKMKGIEDGTGKAGAHKQ